MLISVPYLLQQLRSARVGVGADRQKGLLAQQLTEKALPVVIGRALMLSQPSGFYRVTTCHPGFKAAQDGINFGKTILQHDERRPGAGFFSWSGAVSNIPGIRVQLA